MLTLDDVRLHCRIDGQDEDSLLSVYLSAAKEVLRQHTSRNWYVTAADIPTDDAQGMVYNAAVDAAMLLLIGHWYGNREAVDDSSRMERVELPLGFWHLVQPYRVYEL